MTKISNSNKFKIAGLLLHIIARNLTHVLNLWSYVRIDYNIKQK